MSTMVRNMPPAIGKAKKLKNKNQMRESDKRR